MREAAIRTARACATHTLNEPLRARTGHSACIPAREKALASKSGERLYSQSDVLITPLFGGDILMLQSSRPVPAGHNLRYPGQRPKQEQKVDQDAPLTLPNPRDMEEGKASWAKWLCVVCTTVGRPFGQPWWG